MQRFITFALSFCMPFLTMQAFSQAANDYEKVFGLPSFTLRIFHFPGATDSTVLLQVHTGLLNDILQFVLEDDGRYRAGYDIALHFLDTNGALAASAQRSRDILVGSFPATNSRISMNHEQFVFELPQGDYVLYLDIMDRDTHKHLRRSRPVTVKAFPHQVLRMSSLTFYRSRNSREARPDTLELSASLPSGTQPGFKKQGARSPRLRGSARGLTFPAAPLVLNLPSIFSDPQERIWSHYVVSGLEPGRPFRAVYRLSDQKRQVLAQWDKTYTADSSVVAVLEELTERIVASGQLTLQVRLAARGDSVDGSERLWVKYLPATTGGSATRHAAPAEWQALELIASDEEYEMIASADSIRRPALIEDFWRRRDPTPMTELNELREEFLRRLAFAGLHFAVADGRVPGWLTDRGRLYIVYGEPNWVRSQSPDMEAEAIEVWYYRRLDKRFFFRDRDRNGDFKLFYKE